MRRKMLIFHSLFVVSVVFWSPSSSLEATRTKSYDSVEYRLRSYLFTNYDKSIRPVLNSNTPLRVYTDIFFARLLHVNSWKALSDNAATFQVVLSMRWTDELLNWKAGDYDNLSTLVVPSSKLWVPDIVPVSSTTHKYELTHEPFAVVSSTGKVNISIPLSVETYCSSSDVANERKCDMTFESWAYSSDQVVIQPSSIITSTNVTDLRYRGARISKIINLARLDSKINGLIWSIQQIFIMVRDASGSFDDDSSSMSKLSPGIVLAFIIPFIFLVRPYRYERVLISLVLMLCIFNLLLNMRTVVHLSLLAGTWSLCGLIVIWSIISAHIWLYKPPGTYPPRILKFIFLDCCGRILCIPPTANASTAYTRQEDEEGITVNAEVMDQPLSANITDAVPTASTRDGVAGRTNHLLLCRLSEWQLLCLSIDRFFFLGSTVLCAFFVITSFF